MADANLQRESPSVQTEMWYNVLKSVLSEAHGRLNAAGVPDAGHVVCNDPGCQTQVGHRLKLLIAERDSLREINAELVGALARCEEALFYLLESYDFDYKNWLGETDNDAPSDALDKARSALAKARGSDE